MKRFIVLFFLCHCYAMSQGQPVTYYFQTPFVTLAQNRLHFDLFNGVGSGKTVHVINIMIHKDFSAVTGAKWRADFSRTTSAGTGGTTLTPLKLDSQLANCPAQITARAGATGGAALGTNIKTQYFHSEETNQAAQMQEAFCVWPPLLPFFRFTNYSLILHEGEGVTLKQIDNVTAGVYSVWVAFTVF